MSIAILRGDGAMHVSLWVYEGCYLLEGKLSLKPSSINVIRRSLLPYTYRTVPIHYCTVPFGTVPYKHIVPYRTRTVLYRSIAAYIPYSDTTHIMDTHIVDSPI